MFANRAIYNDGWVATTTRDVIGLMTRAKKPPTMTVMRGDARLSSRCASWRAIRGREEPAGESRQILRPAGDFVVKILPHLHRAVGDAGVT